MTQQTDAERVAAGIDASRRVGWAKYYDVEEDAVTAIGGLLVVNRLLHDGETAEARDLLRRCLTHLQATEHGRTLITQTLEAHGYLADWMSQALDRDLSGS